MESMGSDGSFIPAPGYRAVNWAGAGRGFGHAARLGTRAKADSAYAAPSSAGSEQREQVVQGRIRDREVPRARLELATPGYRTDKSAFSPALSHA